MIRRTTISVGIPAFNEAANIKQLLQLILEQKETNFTLEKIYIVSDGSTDETQSEVLSLKNNKILFKDDKKRLGKSARLEEIFRLNTSDVLILMDADIVFKERNLFSKLIDQVNFEKTGIVGINAQPLPAKTFFEHRLNAGVYTTKRISEQWNSGDNYLTFKGCFLALSGKFVKNLHIPAKLVNNDAYLYFSAKKAGFAAAYCSDCIVYYKSPVTLSDHIKQSSRFQVSKGELREYFSDEILSYSPPRNIIINSIKDTILKNPFYFAGYVGIHILSKISKQKVTKPTWKIADSTKQKIALNN